MKFPALITCLLILTAAVRAADPSHGAQMTTAAKELVAQLSAEQRPKAVLPLDSPDRFLPVVVPGKRAGILCSELTDAQRDAVWKLAASGLSADGQERVKKIMAYDKGLGNYVIAVWGEPDAKKPWAWRLEGHHVSLNYEVEGDTARLRTTMLGANELPLLSAHQDHVLALWESLSADQKTNAANPKDPPGTPRGRAPDLAKNDTVGIKVADLTAAQKEKVTAIVAGCYTIFPDDIAEKARPAALDDAVLSYRHDVVPGKFLFRLASRKFLFDLETRDHLHVTLIPPQ